MRKLRCKLRLRVASLIGNRPGAESEPWPLGQRPPSWPPRFVPCHTGLFHFWGQGLEAFEMARTEDPSSWAPPYAWWPEGKTKGEEKNGSGEESLPGSGSSWRRASSGRCPLRRGQIETVCPTRGGDIPCSRREAVRTDRVSNGAVADQLERSLLHRICCLWARPEGWADRDSHQRRPAGHGSGGLGLSHPHGSEGGYRGPGDDQPV